MLGWDGEVWGLPVTYVTQVELHSDRSIVCGQPRARVHGDDETGIDTLGVSGITSP